MIVAWIVVGLAVLLGIVLAVGGATGWLDSSGDLQTLGTKHTTHTSQDRKLRVAVLAIARPDTDATEIVASLARALHECEWSGIVVGKRPVMGGTGTAAKKWKVLPDTEPPAPRGETSSSPSRMKRLARLRNAALSEAKKQHAARPFDRVVVVDLDVRIDEKELNNVLRKEWPDGVRAIAAQGIKGPLYYDTHAHRWIDEPFPLDPQAWSTSVRKQFKQVSERRSTKTRQLVKLQSAFGGLAVYDAGALLSGLCQYDAPLGDCEHVALHRCVGGLHMLSSLAVKHWWTRQHERPSSVERPSDE
jgi:hypothetical protein